MPHLPPGCVSTEEEVRRFPTLAQTFLFPSVALALGIAIGGFPTRAVRWSAVLAVGALLIIGVYAEATTVSRTGLAAFAKLWRHSGPPDAVLFFPRWNRRVAGYYLGAPVMNVPTRTELEAALRQRDSVRVWEVVRKGNDQRILALALHRVCLERTADSGPAGRTSPGEAR